MGISLISKEGERDRPFHMYSITHSWLIPAGGATSKKAAGAYYRKDIEGPLFCALGCVGIQPVNVDVWVNNSQSAWRKGHSVLSSAGRRTMLYALGP